MVRAVLQQPHRGGDAVRFYIGVWARTTLAVLVCLAGFLMAPFAFPFTFIAMACLWFVPLGLAVWSSTRQIEAARVFRARASLRR